MTIVSMIVHGWPGGAWEVERMESYVDAIMPLDAAVTSRAVGRARNELKYRPSVAELREFVQIERRLSEAEHARYIEPEKPDKPAWVTRWERARRAGDQRPFPEQMTAMDSLARQNPTHFGAYAPPEHPITDGEHWVQPHEFMEDEGQPTTTL